MNPGKSSTPPPREKLAPSAVEVDFLRKISGEINATLDLDALFDVVLRTMDELFGFSHSLIVLVDEPGRVLEVAASRGYPEPPIGAQVEVGSGLIGVVAKRRRMVRLGGLRQQRAYVSTVRNQMEKQGRAQELRDAPPLPGLQNVESQIGIPLMVKDVLIGVFYVESDVKRSFSERDEALVSIVANQAASAIQSARLVRQLFDAHEHLARLNETLEERVRERTEELERANRELSEAQAQLLQTAKLAALGDLVAGVAHEINTPLGTIHANADLVHRAVSRILQALDHEEAFLSRHPNLPRALDALDSASSVTLRASDRIERIVRSLRSFARLDEAERKKVDLHEAIDSTLTLLTHELDGRIDVRRNYGKIPEILCYPNRLNQVFMNLLVNAIHAIGDRGTITIGTWVEGPHVVLEFADTGHGIPAANRERIFDPGFTTKGAGVGTGLGLSISHRIVQEHGGTVAVSSEPGNGAVFTIRLPQAR